MKKLPNVRTGIRSGAEVAPTTGKTDPAPAAPVTGTVSCL